MTGGHDCEKLVFAQLHHELENTKANKVQRTFQIEEKVHFGQFSSIFFFMLKIKNSQKRRNINVSKSLITYYLSQTSSIFYIFRSLSTF
ncbi:hypothetical protein F6P82_11030 [Streptococcus suis]|nr:hypothetical protein [Streptococcus suis]